ncbi:MAG: sporulation protein YqfD [Oscillospiraceae bacterium]|nr:sporulation protein YqfD [Oscillospiraceae bacterium]
MQKIINFFLGSVYVRIETSYPERFLNLCAKFGIAFWDMSNEAIDVIFVRMTVRNFRRLPDVVRKVPCRVHITEKNGLPFFLHRFRKRKALVLGCMAFCVAAWIFTSFVWVIDIEGFSGLDTEKLNENLRKYGLDVGVYASGVDVDAIKNNILIEMPELSYVSVNLNGAYAYVTVKKRSMPPEILSKEIPCDIIADKDGTISDITVKSGTPQVKRGDAVIKGQLLASGYITGRAGTTIITHADAEIRADIWRKVSARMLKKYEKKVYSGREEKVYTIILPKRRIKLSFNSGISYAKCDKIIETTELEFFGGIKLPLALECETFREYKTEASFFTDAEIFDELGQDVHSCLIPGEDAVEKDSDFVTSSDDTFAYATLTVKHNEPIGEKREILKNG